MNPDEIAAAAERLRRIRTENHLEVYRHAYGYLSFTKQKIAASFKAIREDRDLLADAYLAEHAAERDRCNIACRAAVEGALAAAKGLPLHTVAQSSYQPRTLQGDAWENGWFQVANSIDFPQAQEGKCDGITVKHADEPVTRDLEDAAMLIRRLCHCLPGGHPIRGKALDWIRRRGLQGSILREQEG